MLNLNICSVSNGRIGNMDILEAEFTVKSNNAFHQISSEVAADIGLPEGEVVFAKWKRWLEKEVKKLE